jgi:hypothetical protein
MWRTLDRFAVAGRADGEGRLKARLGRIAGRLGIPAGSLETVAAAVARAVLRAAGAGSDSGGRPPVEVEVLASQARRGPRGRAAGQEQPASQGWGFFLIERPPDEAQASARRPARHRIELYLYPEGARAEGDDV